MSFAFGNQRQSQSNQRVCRYYLAGNCHNEECPDSHTIPNRPQGVFSKVKKICLQYSKGNCEYGDNCRYLHEGGGEQDKPDGRGEQSGDNGQVNIQPDYERNGIFGTSEGRQKKMCNYFSRGECNRGSSCHFSHALGAQENEDKMDGKGYQNNNEDQGDNKYDKEQNGIFGTREIREKRVCRNFQQKGECYRGNSCHFSHISGTQDRQDKFKGNEQQQHEDDYQANTNGDDEENVQQNPLEVKGKRICKFYAQNKQCRKGEACGFLHEGEPQQESGMTGPVTKDPRICHAYVQGTCFRGDRCKFTHQDQQVGALSAEVKKDNEQKSKEVEKEQQILKNEEFRFSLIEIGKAHGLENPKEVFSLGLRKIVTFYQNGYLILQMLSKKVKELYEKKKGQGNQQLKGEKKVDMIIEEELKKARVEVQQKDIILEVIQQCSYPIQKIIADKIFISSRRWVLITFKNPINQTYGFLALDFKQCYKQKLQVTKCLAIDIAHSERINGADFCLKNEVFAKEIEEKSQHQQMSYEQLNDYQYYDSHDNPHISLSEKRLMQKDKRFHQKLLMIRPNLIQSEQEVHDIHHQINALREKEEISPEQRASDQSKLQLLLQKSNEVNAKYKELYDNVVKQNEHRVKKDEERYYQDNDYDNDYNNDNDVDSLSFNQDEDLIEQIEKDLKPGRQDEDDKEEEGENNIGAMSDNFQFNSLLKESEYAKELSDLIIFTCSQDGMVKVWLLEKIPGEKDADSSEPKQMNISNKNSAEMKETIELSEEQKPKQKAKRLGSQFEYKAVLDESLSLKISESILSHCVINCIVQVTASIRQKQYTDSCFRRILLLGGVIELTPYYKNLS